MLLFRKKNYLLVHLFILSLTNVFGQTSSEREIITAIQNQDISFLSSKLDSANVNNALSDTTGAPLFVAINKNASKSVRYLLGIKANPNSLFNSRTAIMYAVQKQNIEIVRLLLKYGAEINETDSLGNTVLMIASTGSKLNIVKILIRHGAALNHRNKKGLNARDYAIRSNNKAIAVYLKNVFEKKLPDYFDGPYMSFITRKKIKVTYLKHDSLRKRTDDIYRIFKLKNLNGKLNGFAGDGNEYSIRTKFQRPPTEIKIPGKLLVIGDVHGQYDTLKLFLQNNQIIDQHLNWNFGNGTVVFMGDIFDRGEKVTEILWMIYRLEKEAASAGGSVQLILGNHEMMVFHDDERYICEKYFYLFRNLKLNYSKQYNTKSLMGRWLRSKNSFLKIDTLLFTHGGIHPNLLDYKLSLDSINSLVNNYLNSKHKNKLIENPALLFLLSYNGPFWYRGMVEESDEKQITDEEINQIFSEYNVTHLFVGHTFKPEVKTFNGGKIISTDVPFYLPDGFPMQALLLEDQKFVLLNSRGERREFDLNK